MTMSIARSPKMREFAIEVDATPPTDVPATTDLFHDPRFYALHAAGRGGVYLAARDRHARVLGVAHAFELESGVWASPGRGTFGGIQWLDGMPTLSDIERCYAALETAVHERGARHLTVIHPPDSHAPSEVALMANVLGRRGYMAAVSEINYTIDIDARSLAERAQLNKRQRILVASRHGVIVRALARDEHAEGFDLVAQHRAHKGIPLTMSFAAVRRMDDALPERVVWLGAFREQALIGAIVLLRVRPDVLYIAFPGERIEEKRLNPVTVLVNAAYEEARRSGARLLDYGIATDQGVPNDGLMTFKQELGFIAGSRVTWIRRWDAA